MVIIVMFDLPTETKKQKKSYRIFRQNILNNGFTMMQYSIYFRYSMNDFSTQKYIKKVEDYLPKDTAGSIRLLKVTSKQFEEMKIYYSADKEKQEKKPKSEQLLLF